MQKSLYRSLPVIKSQYGSQLSKKGHNKRELHCNSFQYQQFYINPMLIINGGSIPLHKNLIANFSLKCLTRINSNNNMPQSSSRLYNYESTMNTITIGKKLQLRKQMTEMKFMTWITWMTNQTGKMEKNIPKQSSPSRGDVHADKLMRTRMAA